MKVVWGAMGAVRAMRGALQSVARMAGERVGMLPEDLVQGGLIDDADVTLQDCKWTIYDYNGKSDPKTCLLLGLLDDDGALHEHYLSAANPEHIVPDDDGMFVVATGDKKNMNKGSNYEAFMLSLRDEGFPMAEFAKNGAAALNGLKVHVIRKPAPKRSGIINRPGQENRELTQLVVSKIIELPGKGKGKGAGAGASKPSPAKPATAAGKPAPKAASAKAAQAPAAATDTDDALDTRLMTIVAEVIEEQGGAVDKKTLAMQTYRKAEASDKKVAAKRVVDEEFLEAGAAMGQWEYDSDNGQISAA